MSDCMTFPDTVEEFMEQYKIVDAKQVYTNGAELVPIFRMKQWFEHLQTIEPEPSIPISWIEGHIDWLKDMNNGFANITAMNIETMLRKWREEQAVRI